MHETLFQPATDAALMLSRREISSRELTQLLLARIDAVNPALNAVVELQREAALRQAAAADDAIARGDQVGPLHGVPMTIKDCFNVAGLHTTWGNPAFKDFVADTDATAVPISETRSFAWPERLSPSQPSSRSKHGWKGPVRRRAVR